MGNERLRSTLRQLHQELAQAEGVDPETLASLQALTDDVERALDTRGEEPANVEAEASGLKDLLLRFEAEHPQLSVAIGRVADALAAMGI
jgi:Domain of unknown function (DUF4404)